MAFAPVLNAYCTLLGCSNKDLAERCEVSMSALSRYRNGKRTPRASSDVIDQLAEGIAALAQERGVASAASKPVVKQALKDSLITTQPLGPSFSARVDSLMKLLGIRNFDVAMVLHMDSSYISRIRRGERTPNDKKRFADAVSSVAAERSLEEGLLPDLLTLIGAADSLSEWERLDIDNAANLESRIRRWLLGNDVVESDIVAFDALLTKVDQYYFDNILNLPVPPAPSACENAMPPKGTFFEGEDLLWRAEMLFLENAIECGASHLFLSSDMPGLESDISESFKRQYQQALLQLIARGCEVTVIHSADRPLRDTIKAMEMWIPLYFTGGVSPLYMQGAGNRLFCHVNNVCECCVLAGEAVRGREGDGRFYLSSLPSDLAYYQKKMGFILEKASSLLEIYRADDPEGMKRFRIEEAQRQASGRGKEVQAGRYEHLRIITYPSDCVVIHIEHPLDFVFVMRHPKLRFIISHMQ